MKIKSLDELRKIKEESQSKVRLRQQGKGDSDDIEVLIGMATCGISSGARETLNSFVDELARQNIDNVKVISVGCVGYCHSEPTVQVNVIGQEPVLYGNVKKKEAEEIIEKHIKGGKIVENLKLDLNFERA